MSKIEKWRKSVNIFRNTEVNARETTVRIKRGYFWRIKIRDEGGQNMKLLFCVGRFRMLLDFCFQSSMKWGSQAQTGFGFQC